MADIVGKMAFAAVDFVAVAFGSVGSSVLYSGRTISIHIRQYRSRKQLGQQEATGTVPFVMGAFRFHQPGINCCRSQRMVHIVSSSDALLPCVESSHAC